MNTPLETISTDVDNKFTKEKREFFPEEVHALTLARVVAAESIKPNSSYGANSSSSEAVESRVEKKIYLSEPAIQNSTDKWRQFRPFRSVPPGRPYPIHALPPEFREAVEQVCDYVQAPIPLAANSALACLATACQAHIDVCRDESLKGPTSLYIVTLADSGERKTTCDSFFSNELKAVQKKVQIESQHLVDQFNADMAIWESQFEGLKSGIKRLSSGAKIGNGKTLDEMNKNMADLVKVKPKAPKILKILRTDDTSENLQYALMHEYPSAGIISSEGGMVFSSRGLSKENIKTTLPIYNSLWDGGTWDIGRKTSAKFEVAGGRLSMGILLQPLVFEQFLSSSDGLARGGGFLARTLLCHPESTQGTRLYKKRPETMDKLDAFNLKIRKIVEMEPRFENGILVPFQVPLSKEAHKIWEKFHNDIEIELAVGKKYSFLKDVASKQADNAARIAALFSAIKGFPVIEVDADSMQRGCTLALWYLDEADRYFGKQNALELAAINDAQSLEKWLLESVKDEGIQKFSTSMILKFGPNHLRSKEMLDPAIEILVARNRARFVNDSGQKILEINPQLTADIGS